MNERTLVFGDSARLVGVLTEADEAASDGRRPAVLLLNSGLIHRVAPNRLYVRMARRLAACGHDSLRFDFSGIGDSTVRTDALPVEESGIAESREAMDLLERLRGHRRFILGGICGGGYFSFRTACRDERVVGLALLNVRGHLHGEDRALADALDERALQLHYRRIAVAPSYRRKNLRKVLRGEFDVKGALASLVRRGRDDDGEELASFRGGQDYDALCDRSVRVLNLYSEGDWSIDYLTAALGPEAARRLSRPGSSFEQIEGTNHLFTPRWSQERVLEALADWVTTTPWEAADASS